MAVEVSLAEIFCCVSATPNIILGSICYADLYSLVTIPHPEIIPCSNRFPMILETRKHVWVTINKIVLQITTLIQIHEKVLKLTEDKITTLYTPNKLKSWGGYNSFPSYMKSSHQKIMNSI